MLFCSGAVGRKTIPVQVITTTKLDHVIHVTGQLMQPVCYNSKKLNKTLSAASVQIDDWMLYTFVKVEVHVEDILVSPTQVFPKPSVHQ